MLSNMDHDEHHRSLPVPHPGFVSPMAKVYFSDVLDHVESAISSLELFANLCQQLEDYTFNLLSFSSNQTMKSLTYITIVS